MQKVPFLLVVCDKEAEAGKVNVRSRGKEKTEDMPAADFVEKIRKLIAEKSRGVTSLWTAALDCPASASSLRWRIAAELRRTAEAAVAT